MRKTILLAIFCTVLLVGVANAATWVDDPNDCPSTFQGQGPVLGKVLCGYNEGIAYFYDPSNINPPAGSTTTSSNIAGFDGGYLIECEAYDGGEPYCDNSGAYWCDRNSSCYNVNRLTNCTGGSFGESSCAGCISGYTYCDGSYTDEDGCEVQIGVTSYPGEANAHYNSSCGPECNSNNLDCDSNLGDGGNGCEVTKGSTPFGTNNAHYGSTCSEAVCDSGWMACEGDQPDSEGCNYETGVTSCTTGGGEPGVWQSGCTCTALPQEDFVTNTLATGFGDNLLYGNQTKVGGNLINLTSPNATFVVDGYGCIIFDDGSRQCNATGGVGDGTGGWVNDSYSTNTSLNVATEGNLTLGQKITFALGAIIDNVVNGWMRITGSLNVTGNLTVQGTSLKVSGNEVCLEDGTNCPAGVTDTVWDITGSDYLVNESGVLDVNETKLNETIDDRSVGSEEIVWINTSNQILPKPGYPKNLNVTGNLSGGGLIIIRNGSETIILY